MKKCFATALVLVLVLSLAACGGSGSSGTGGANPPASQGNSTSVPASPGSIQDNTPSSEDTRDEQPAFTEGVWPDVEHTQQVPKPSFTVSTIEDEYYASMKWLRINFVDVTYDDAIAYVEELKTTGYTAEENIVLDSPGSAYIWNAENSAGGWYVSFSVNEDGEASLEIRKV